MALIVISDGGDNSSRYTMNELMSFAMESDAQIYTIGVFGNPGTQELLSSGRRAGGQIPPHPRGTEERLLHARVEQPVPHDTMGFPSCKPAGGNSWRARRLPRRL